MADFVGDVRYVLRGWRRAPAVSATMLATLTLGLGLATAIFSFADGYLFRPLPFPSADQVYRVSIPNGTLLASEAVELRRSSLAGLGFVQWSVDRRVDGELVVGERHVAVRTDAVSPGFRRVVQLPLLAGRDFGEDDHREGGPVPGWLSHRFWQREFGGDPGVVGRTLPVESPGSSAELTIVGILGPEVVSFDLNNRPPDIIVPRVEPAVVGPNRLAHPIVRLPEGMSREQGEARIAAELQAVAPAADGKLRAARRTREFGIRLALGAGPADLWRSVVRQSVVPACYGLALGLGGAIALESFVRASVFGWESSGVGAASLVTLALFVVAVAGAAAPARRAMRVDPSVTLRME